MRKNEYAVMSVSVQYCKVWNTTHSKYLKHWPRIFLTYIAKCYITKRYMWLVHISILYKLPNLIYGAIV